MIYYLVAHAGEEHSDVTEAVAHFAPSYISVPVFLVATAMIGYLVWLVSGKKLDTTLFVLALTMLITGFTVFNIAPIVSVLAITTGIIIAGFLAFVSIAGDTKK